MRIDAREVDDGRPSIDGAAKCSTTHQSPAGAAARSSGPVAPDDVAKTIEAFVDVLIPGDADFPSASAAGTHGLVADRIRTAHGSAGIVALAEELEANGPFLAGDRTAAVARFERAAPARFFYARFVTYYAYYQMPAVVMAIARLGHDYHDAPQPLGYRMAPYDEDRDAPKHGRGSYKKTDEIAGVDLSSLADLNLPLKG